jgi:hypothetical protein
MHVEDAQRLVTEIEMLVATVSDAFDILGCRDSEYIV